MVVYVNKVYIRSDLISYVQIVIHDRINLKNVYYTDEYSRIVLYCRKLQDQGYQVIPLATGTFLIDPSVRKEKINVNTKIELGFQEEDTSSSSIYMLYSKLAKAGAVLLSDDYPYADGYRGLLSQFSNIEISNKNMEITIPVLYGKDKVADFKVVSQEGEMVSNNRFNVAVPAHRTKELLKTDLVKRGTINLNNQDFVVYSYLRGASIFRSIDFIEVPDPVIVMYLKQKEFYHTISIIIEKLLMHYNVGSYAGKNSTELSFSDLFSNYSGVFFRPTNLVSTGDIDKMVSIVLENGKDLLGNRQLENKKLSNAISKMLESKGLDKKHTKALLVVFTIYKMSANNINLINSLVINHSKLKNIILDIELYLYSLRIGIYDVCKRIYPDKSLITLKSYSSEVRMEVWRK